MSIEEGMARKEHGLDLVELSNEDFMIKMRQIAYNIAKTRGVVTSDDIRDAAANLGITPTTPNAWGAVIRGHAFEFTGKMVKSRHTTNHARKINQYRLASSAPVPSKNTVVVSAHTRRVGKVLDEQELLPFNEK